MNNFPKPEMDSLAGLDEFYFVQVEKVNTIPDPVDSFIDSLIVLKSGVVWLKGYAAIDTLKLSEKPQLTNHGQIIKSELSGFVPDSVSIQQLFSEMAGKKFVVKAKDNDGRVRLIGSIEQPLEFIPEFDTQTVSQQKGHLFRFSGNLSWQSPFYDISSPTGNDDYLYDEVRVMQSDDNGFPLVTNYYYHEELLFTINSTWNSAGIKVSTKVAGGQSLL